MTDIRTRHSSSEVAVATTISIDDAYSILVLVRRRPKARNQQAPNDRDILATAISPPSRSRELNGHSTGSSAAAKPVRWIGIDAIQRATNPAVDGRALPRIADHANSPLAIWSIAFL